MCNYQKVKECVGIDKGTLDSGVTYYLINNTIKCDIIELFLVVNAGSSSDFRLQEGVAHYLEHMLLVFDDDNNHLAELEDISGYTNFDETVFHISCVNKKQCIDKAIELIARIITGEVLQQDKMEQVRKDIIEEWEYQINYEDFKKNKVQLAELYIEDELDFEFKDENFRERNKIFSYMKQGFKQDEDFPIGRLEAIEKMEFDTIKDFHRLNYQMENLKLIVIGNFCRYPILSKVENTIGNFKNDRYRMQTRVKKSYPSTKKSYLFQVHNEDSKFQVNIYLLKDYSNCKAHYHTENFLEQTSMYLITQYIKKQLSLKKYRITDIYTEVSWIMRENKVYSIQIAFDYFDNAEVICKEIRELLNEFKLNSLNLYEKRRINKQLISYLREDFTETILNKCIGECVFGDVLEDTPHYYRVLKRNINELTANKINAFFKDLIEDAYIYIYCNSLSGNEKVESLASNNR